MAVSTDTIRAWWSPACKGPWLTYKMYGAGKVSVRPAIKDALVALNDCLVAANYATRAKDTGAYNCLAGETEIITREGIFPISSLVGQDVELLTRRGSTGNSIGGSGAWRFAPIKSYGEQALRKITLSSAGISKTIYATPEHRWLVRKEPGGKIFEVTTDELIADSGRNGHKLLNLFPQSVASRTIPSPVGICAGLVYGDGTVSRYSAQVALFGDKNINLAKYFSSEQKQSFYKSDEDISWLLISGLPKSWKKAPQLDEGSAYLYGWLAGYFAADGRVTKNGSVELNSTNRESLELARTVALRLGISTRPIRQATRMVTPPGSSLERESTIYGIGFISSSLDSSFFLIPEHRERFNAESVKASPTWKVEAVEESDRFEEVYCAEVEDTECFVLDDFILTGNCRNVTNGTKKSLHAYGIAVDLNWQSNPYGRRLITDMPVAMRNNIKAIRTNNGKQVWRWGGDYSGNKDAMHWEITCSPKDLATGINWNTVPGKTVSKSNKVIFKPGDRGQGVKFVEVLLNKFFRPAPQIKLREDGIYDNQTIAGVREFQLDHNKIVKAAQRLRTDGIVDERTLEAISFWIALKTR